MIRKWLLALVFLIVAVVAANYWPLLHSHAEQDECTFGPISNQQYRSFLSDAKNRQRTTWPALGNESREIGRKLNARLTEMPRGETSIYARIGIVHALLRAIGAEYLNTNGRQDADPYQAATLHRDNVVFNYEVDINRLVLFQPYPRQVWIQVVLADPDRTRPDVLAEYGPLYLVVHVLSFLERPADRLLMRSGSNCPPLPSPEIATRYERILNR